MRKWRNVLFAGVAASMLLATACGAEKAQPANANAVQPAAGTASPSLNGAGSGSGSGSGSGPLGVRADAKLGSLVTDSAGMTLYRFDKDTPSPAKSNCEGACATTWPPVPAGDMSASSGLNRDLIGWVSRADGTKQMTLAGWPLYRYAKDTQTGDTNGQGVGGTWFASAPDGKKAGVARPAIGVLNSPTLGKILTDRNGMTLYLFTKDHPWPMKTACDATCLKKWKPSAPITAEEAKAAGIDPALLFTFTTPNGTKQEAINCWPAYTFVGDTQPGQTNGQGVGGVWFAITKDAKIDRGKTIPAAKGKNGGSSQSDAPPAEAPSAGASTTEAPPADNGSSSSGGGYGY